METLQAASDTLFILLGAIMVLAMHAGFAFLELGTVRRKNQVNALVQDPGRLRRLHDRVFLHRLRDRLRRHVLRQRRNARAEERLRAGEVLLPAHVRRGDPGDRLGRHRRAREVQSAARGARSLLVGFVYPFFEGIAWNQHFGVQAWLEGDVRRGVPRFRRQRRRACDRRLDRAGRGAAARRRGAAATPQDGGIAAHPPSSIPVPRARRMDAHRRAGSAST